MADIDLKDYVEVPERIAEFRAKHPEGCLRPVNPEQPYSLEILGERAFIVYAAAAYRSPEDPCPGIGCAWEQFPGTTPYTKNSELMNAETSAWGRAIVAVLAADSKRGIATAEEVRNRLAEQEQTAPERPPNSTVATEQQIKTIWAVSKSVGWDKEKLYASLESRFGEGAHPDTLTRQQASAVIEGLKELEKQQEQA